MRHQNSPAKITDSDVVKFLENGLFGSDRVVVQGTDGSLVEEQLGPEDVLVEIQHYFFGDLVSKLQLALHEGDCLLFVLVPFEFALEFVTHRRRID